MTTVPNTEKRVKKKYNACVAEIFDNFPGLWKDGQTLSCVFLIYPLKTNVTKTKEKTELFFFSNKNVHVKYVKCS